jgi:hypothetical protein
VDRTRQLTSAITAALSQIVNEWVGDQAELIEINYMVNRIALTWGAETVTYEVRVTRL